jgi:hypothetical protein
MKKSPTIPLAKVTTELALAGITTRDTDKTTLYALIKVWRCWGMIATVGNRQQVLIDYLNDPLVREKIAQDCSDLSSLKNVCELLQGPTNRHWQRCDLDDTFLNEWEGKMIKRLPEVSKLPKISDPRRRWNRYHFGKFATYLNETLKLRNGYALQVINYALEKVATATEAEWTANDLNWGWQIELIDTACSMCSAQYRLSIDQCNINNL